MRIIFLVGFFASPVSTLGAVFADLGAVLAEPPLLLPNDNGATGASGFDCNTSRTPRVHALLIGVDDYKGTVFKPLVGPGNDVVLLTQTLRQFGLDGAERLTGRVTAESFSQKATAMAAQMTCGDTFLLHYSGHSFLASDRSALLLFSDSTILDRTPQFELRSWPAGTLSSVDRRRTGVGLVDTEELLVLFDQLRDRGVNVVFIMDSHAPPSLLGAMVGARSGTGAWAWKPWEGGAPALEESSRARGALFAMLAPQMSTEMVLPPRQKEQRIHGTWSYAVASALLSEGPQVSFRRLSEVTSANLDALGDKAIPRRTPPGPAFFATHPNRPPLALGVPGREQAAPTLRGRSDRRIEFTNPPVLTRGAVPVPALSVQIEGRVVSAEMPRLVQANQQVARLNSDGSFSVRLPLTLGENHVVVVAWFDDVDFLPARITLLGTTESAIAPLGKSYALVIGNRRYRDPSFSPLVTPHDDARRVADLLSTRYGYATELPQAGGRLQPLVLLDAGREEMARALSSLRRNLQPEDTLLIYFAGHGIYEKETGQAYWLPVDAEREEPQTWFSAHDLQAAVQRLNARHVLVVADSCFSGALIQRGDAPPVVNANRDHFLTQLMLRNSRRFIASGGNEPVLDGGGQGHSVFAQAFIDALISEEGPFSATELFSRHLAPRVTGKTTQVPQQFPMREGHDGGDLVFFPNQRPSHEPAKESTKSAPR